MPSATTPPADLAKSDAGTLDPLRVIIAYDERSAYRRAMRMLANTFCNDFQTSDIRPLPWRFDELALPPWRKHATADATHADIFVVSTSGTLPEVVKEWLHSCFAVRRARPTAIVLLSDQNPETNPSECGCRQFLQRAAAAAGLDFLEPHVAVEALAVPAPA